MTRRMFIKKMKKITAKGAPSIYAACPQGIDARYSFLDEKSPDESVCISFCHDFVNVPIKKARHSAKAVPTCPCYIFGRKSALQRAKLALNRWNKGTHKWQKKGGKKSS